MKGSYKIYVELAKDWKKGLFSDFFGTLEVTALSQPLEAEGQSRIVLQVREAVTLGGVALQRHFSTLLSSLKQPGTNVCNLEQLLEHLVERGRLWWFGYAQWCSHDMIKAMYVPQQCQD
ncbi:hypothetical protein T265_01514 [Opisthorchis viverrini]|uniref:Uncharacterized protein n=1 Tax=Opisthorchis viverrini TaxID=6198 RepID=A0A074ZZF2_OPIVI|nr:hypothetical protein T265_01514 [Opisthorchis viverrini]KER32461.1 hypothetical protein T265_01514 [Opisthorchis viverrini]